MPYALCPMPYALCPMPYALCPMPYALCPMPYAFLTLLAHLMHINEFYVVPCKDLELSHSGGRIRWKYILGFFQDGTPSPARERHVDRWGLIFQD
jgi:hypothetical protein